MNALYPSVAQAEGRCEYCHAPQSLASGLFEVEHIEPVSQGGTDELSNLALACSACNKYKGNVTMALDPHTGQMTALFNPRMNDWETHFSLNEETHEMVGRTRIGRTTIVRLRLNNDQQKTARPFWRRLELFP